MSKRADENSARDSRADDTDAHEPSRETLPPRTLPDSTLAAPVSELPDLKSFGRYTIIRQLGQGAMGAVYLARDTQLDRQVALKIPKFFAHDGPEVKERFQREARAAATLSHRNICAVHDIGEVDGTPYMTMAYIEGLPLSEYVREKIDSSELETAVLLRKLAITLQEAHDKGIIHRDLKPANILVDEKNEPVLMDFGLARLMNSKESVRITHSGALLGSPAYMSPEQVEGNIDLMGPSADIYSLGVVAYELLTGELPFHGSVAVVISQIVSAEPKALAEINPAVDPRLEAICLKMMAKCIEDRYQSMAEVAEALEQYLDHPDPLGESGTVDESLVAELSGGSLAISGCDLARGLALIGMMIVNFRLAAVGNFRLAAAGELVEPEWLNWIVERIHGRAAALFVVLLGIGFSYLADRARKMRDAGEIQAVRKRTLVRAALLFVGGYLYQELWPGDLLHYCGLFLAIGAMLMTASGRVLWTFTVVLILFFSGLFMGFEGSGRGYFDSWGAEAGDYVGHLAPIGAVRHLFFNGYHPVVPWVAFFLVGMWLGRLNLRNRQTQYRIAWIGLSVALVTELLSALNVMILSRVEFEDPDFDYNTIVALFGTTPIPPLPLFMLATGGTAVAVVAGCLLLSGRKAGARLREPLIAGGRMGITLYVAHVLLGMGVLKATDRLGGQSLVFAVTAALVLSALLVICAVVWSRYYRRGPLEWLIWRLGG